MVRVPHGADHSVGRHGGADITPSDPDAWAAQLGRALARVHATPSERISALPSVFDRNGGSLDRLQGPAAQRIRSSWPRITASPDVLTHSDYWSGNVVWHDGALTGIVDWSGGLRGPRGYDVGWCRLDLYLLFGDSIADAFLAAYEHAIGHPLRDVALWDGWALARSYDSVETWTPNYRPLGAPTSTSTNFDGATPNGQHVSSSNVNGCSPGEAGPTAAVGPRTTRSQNRSVLVLRPCSCPLIPRSWGRGYQLVAALPARVDGPPITLLDRQVVSPIPAGEGIGPRRRCRRSAAPRIERQGAS